jgi:hypothetical protein
MTMTDEQQTDEQQTDEQQEQQVEVEVTDEEALASVDLSALGVTSEPNESNLNRLNDLYLTHFAKVQVHAEKTKKGDTTGDIRSEVRKQLEQAEIDDDVKNLGSDLLEQVYNILEADESQILHVMTALGEVLKYVTDTRECVFAVGINKAKQEQGITFTPDEEAEESKLICQAVRAMMTTLLKIAKLLNKPIPDSIPVKSSKSGDLLPDLPGLPKSRTGASNLGRAAKASRVKYSWKASDAEEFSALKDGILTNEIANFVISQGSYRITHSDLMDRFKKGGTDQFSHTPWELEFETGTLRGFVPEC